MLPLALDPGQPNAAAQRGAHFAEPEAGQNSKAQQPELAVRSMWVGLSVQHSVWARQVVRTDPEAQRTLPEIPQMQWIHSLSAPSALQEVAMR
jgi:hypothetical protein